MPILCSTRSTVKRAWSFSTTKQLSRWWRGVSSPSAVTANTTIRSATLPWLMKRLLPSMIQSASPASPS